MFQKVCVWLCLRSRTVRLPHVRKWRERERVFRSVEVCCTLLALPAADTFFECRGLHLQILRA
jgi:hypothetical protein